ncbi:MAG TPA: DUF3857 and transglutaminase domain-containing protein [Rhizomicrobium sp.]|nr:DUF3857 and transglutaminase domain-containing protein [Rhizomicrobium sp.]
MRASIRQAALTAGATLLVWLAAPGSPRAQTPAAPGVPARFVAIEHHIDVHADGSWTTNSHVELQLVTSQLIGMLSQRALEYSDSMQSLEIKAAYTLKRDGSQIPVPASSIITRQKSTPEPYFTDIKEKVILFPDVEAGDTLVYDTALKSEPPIPGQFYYALYIPQGAEVDGETISFVTPKSYPLNFDVYGLNLVKSSAGDSLTYTIHYANRLPIGEPQQYLSELDRGLRFFTSSSRSYDALANAYGALAMPKTAVTPKIQAKADDITAGVSDRREQARLLYNWVSTHVRYVAVLFGDGGLVPHDADSTLTNAFGDCKDHAVLYSALLRAKGISSDLVIVNASNGYTVSQVPEMLSFNHMIVWIPEFGLYADTTSNSTPFGILPQLEYGKPVVHVGGERQALRQTPVLAEKDSSYTSSTILKLDSSGMVSGQQSATATGVVSSVLRSLANEANTAGVVETAATVLRTRKLNPVDASYEFQQTTEITPKYTYKSSYRARPEDNPSGFVMPEGLNIIDASSPAVLGPVADARFKDADTESCLSGDVSDDYTLELPPDKKLKGLPQDTLIETPNLRYLSHWSVAGNRVSVHHELQAHYPEPLCGDGTRIQTINAIVQMRNDYLTPLALEEK